MGNHVHITKHSTLSDAIAAAREWGVEFEVLLKALARSRNDDLGINAEAVRDL